MRTEKAKEIASRLLKVGKSKIWVNPQELNSVKEAITKEDIRELIRKGTLKKTKKKWQSRGRAKELKMQKEKGRRKGKGKRKGKKSARIEGKRRWIANVRAQRSLLRKLRKEMPNQLKEIGYRKIYNMIKGGYFKSKSHLERYIREGK
ncbi:MAG: 50S ribosomal protein L19e [Candidatus Diapherotrites archaeon]|nr:50S ribosomal protein L19e [Candidatus Diapherotrites archaeon]